MPTESHGMQLADYLSILRRRKWLVIIATLLVIGSTLAVSLMQTPVYQGRARVLLRPDLSPFETDTNTGLEGDLLVTEIQVLQGGPVRQQVRERLGSAPPINAIRVSGSAVIEIRSESTSPARAAEIANAYAQSYIEYRRKTAVDNLLAVSDQLQNRIDALQKDIDDLGARLAALPPCSPTGGGCAERDSLQRDRDARVQQQVPFKQKLDQLQVDLSVKNGGAQLVSEATPPTEPIRPQPMRNALLGLAVGMLFGVALAFVFEHLDDSIKTKEDLERSTRDVSVLGLIPVVGTWRRAGEPFVVSLVDPLSNAAEAYRTLRTSIQFAAMNRPLRSLQVTSPSPSEGKSTTVSNLAVAMANTGKSVIIVSCDLRRPRLHEFFELSNDVGFTSVLLGETSLDDALQKVPEVDGLRMLSSGPLPPNPSELLSLPASGNVFEELETRCDLVIVDCPPVLPVTDAAVISARMDATLLVVTAGVTTGKHLGRTVEILRQVNAPLIGAVLNAVRTEGGYGPYYYRYRYYDNGAPSGLRRTQKQPAVSRPTAEKRVLRISEK